MAIIELSMVVSSIISMGLGVAWEKTKRYEVRREAILKLLKRFNLDPSDPPNDFDSIYVYTLVEYGIGKPEPVLNFFRNEFVREAFRQSFYKNDSDILDKEAEGIIEWNEETGKLGRIDYDPRREFAAFSVIFHEIVFRTRTPLEVKRDQKLDIIHGDLHQKTGEIIERLSSLKALDEIREELSRLVQTQQQSISDSNLVIQQFISGMTALPTDYAARIQNFLIEYLGTPNRPVPFGGREADLAILDSWLDDALSPPYLLLAAPAGRGKSALLTRWSQRLVARKDLAVAFLPISIRFRTNLSGVFFAALSARLAGLYGEPLSLSAGSSAEMWRGTVSDYLDRSLPDGRRLLLILDGVDEAADWEPGPDLFPLAPSRGLCIVLSARYLASAPDTDSWLERLGWKRPGLAQALVLNPLDLSGVADVLKSMGFPLDRLGARVDIVTELHRLSEGDPLLVRLYVGDLWERKEVVSQLLPEDLRSIRPGLKGYFDRWWGDQRHLWGNQAPLREPAVQALLTLFACALGSLSWEDVLHQTGLTSWTLEEALYPLERFVIGDGRRQGYTFSHPRLAAYFYEQLSKSERQAMESRFLIWGEETLTALNEGQLSLEQASSYIVQYYGAHLERVGYGAKILLTLVSNGWRKAWEALEGTYAGFLSDAERAWRTAEQDDTVAIRSGKLASYVGGEVRCALCRASVNSLAKNIPPTLLIDAVKHKIWLPARGLAYAKQVPDIGQRAVALAGLTPSMVEPQKTEVLQEVLEAIWAIEDEAERSEVLAELAPFLPESLQKDALKAALEIKDETEQARSLVALIPFLPQLLLLEVLEAANKIQDEGPRAEVLVGLVSSRPKMLLWEVLEIVRTIEDEGHRARTLVALNPHFPEMLKREILEVALAIEDEEYRAWVLAELVVTLPEALKGKVLKAGQAMQGVKHRVELLTRLAPALPELLLQELLEAVWSMENEKEQATVLIKLSPILPEELKGQTLKIVRGIRDERDRAEALAALVSSLPKELQQEVLRVIRGIKHERDRTPVLVALIPSLSQELQQDVLKMARQMRDEGYRARALAELAPYLSEDIGHGR